MKQKQNEFFFKASVICIIVDLLRMIWQFVFKIKQILFFILQCENYYSKIVICI